MYFFTQVFCIILNGVLQMTGKLNRETGPDRREMLKMVEVPAKFDVIVIGGGATGCGMCYGIAALSAHLLQALRWMRRCVG